jgi:Phosphotransferase enzyme family
MMLANIPTTDPFGITGDPQMPFLAQALDPLQARCKLERHRARLASVGGQIELRAVRVTRYKPGRRCLIEYDVAIERPGAPSEALTLVGKARARGLDEPSFQLLDLLWAAGFGAASRDGVCVPEPIGTIPEFQMWLQRKVPGAVATRRLVDSDGVTLARRIVEAVHKLHQAGILPHRRHTMADELRILHERLARVAQMEPRWEPRLDRVRDTCDRLGADIFERQTCGIHRDFYPDQVIVSGARLYLLDLDLYSAGDPALDIGNFIGHLTELSLRTLGDPLGLADREAAMAERFAELAGPATRAAVGAYATLTLVRHVYLSTQFPERRPFTEALLELCEQRLSCSRTSHSFPIR